MIKQYDYQMLYRLIKHYSEIDNFTYEVGIDSKWDDTVIKLNADKLSVESIKEQIIESGRGYGDLYGIPYLKIDAGFGMIDYIPCYIEFADAIYDKKYHFIDCLLREIITNNFNDSEMVWNPNRDENPFIEYVIGSMQILKSIGIDINVDIHNEGDIKVYNTFYNVNARLTNEVSHPFIKRYIDHAIGHLSLISNRTYNSKSTEVKISINDEYSFLTDLMFVWVNSLIFNQLRLKYQDLNICFSTNVEYDNETSERYVNWTISNSEIPTFAGC